MHRTIATSCESLSKDPSLFPTPRRIRRPSHPNLFSLRFRPKLMPSHFCSFPAMGQGSAGQGGGRAGQRGAGRLGKAEGRVMTIRDQHWCWKRTCSVPGAMLGATVPMAVERRAGVLVGLSRSEQERPNPQTSPDFKTPKPKPPNLPQPETRIPKTPKPQTY